MKCPECSKNLKSVKLRNTIIRVCLNCRGIWFEQDNFLKFARDLSEEVTASEKQFLFKQRTVLTSRHTAESKRKCPRCHQDMKVFNYAYDSNIFLDRCEECHGIWTDAGEIHGVAQHIRKDPNVGEIGRYLAQKNRTFEDASGVGDLLTSRVPVWILWAPKIILPLLDDQPIKRIPWMTILFIILCSLVFLFTLFVSNNPEDVFHTYGFKPSSFLSYGLITSIFLHGGWLHLIGNMYFLWLFGDNIEDRLRIPLYLILFFGSAIAADCLHTLINMNSDIPCVGASGAISGIMGAYLIFYPRARIKVFVFYRIVDVSAAFYLAVWFALQVFYASLSSIIGTSHVAWFAHLGGFAFGLMFGYIYKLCSQKSNDMENE